MSAARSAHATLNALASTCSRQCELYEQLLACFEQKEAAIRLAKADELQQIAAQEVALLRELRTIDSRRRQQQKSLLAGGGAAESGDLIERLAPEQREIIQPVLARLKSAADRVRTRSAVLRAAAESLSAHLSGIVRAAWSAMEQNTVYERSGRVAAGSANLGIDVKS